MIPTRKAFRRSPRYGDVVNGSTFVSLLLQCARSG